MRYNIAPLLLLSSGASAAAVGKKAPKGFVTREGELFKLDGKDFYFAGSNAYYFPFNDVRAFPDIFELGLINHSLLRTSNLVLQPRKKLD